VKILFIILVSVQLSFGCLCESLIQKNVKALKENIVEDSQKPYQDSINDSIAVVKKQKKFIEKNIKNMDDSIIAQMIINSKIDLLIKSIDSQNKQLQNQIKMESTK
jgi:hypothetical protein